MATTLPLRRPPLPPDAPSSSIISLHVRLADVKLAPERRVDVGFGSGRADGDGRAERADLAGKSSGTLVGAEPLDPVGCDVVSKHVVGDNRNGGSDGGGGLGGPAASAPPGVLRAEVGVLGAGGDLGCLAHGAVQP